MKPPSLYSDYQKYLAIDKDTEKDHVDLSHIHFVAPASVIPAIFFARSNRIKNYNTYDEETNNHLNKILGRSESNSNLLPLLNIKLNKSVEERDKCLDKLNDDIFKLLFPTVHISHTSYGGIKTFPYIIGEIIDNIKQHAGAKSVYSYSQRYPSADCIDVGILDDGDTIPGKYEQASNRFYNENGLDLYEVENDCEAIFRSLNGISTKESFRGSRSIRFSKSVKDIVDSGAISLGINSSIRLITEGLGGSFLIASRGGICHLANGKANFISAKHDPIDGTFVCMRFERKYLQTEEYEKIAYNYDTINDEDGKFKLVSKKLDV